MALSLRFAEEGEFSSRAGNAPFLADQDVPRSQALFRWSRPVRELLKQQHECSAAVVAVETLIVAMPGSPQRFVQELSSSWETVGTLLTTDQPVQPCRLDATSSAAPSAGLILSKKGVDVTTPGNTLVLLVAQDVPVAATWAWLDKLREHIDAQEIVCLDSQLSTIYADAYADAEPGPQLRMLASSSVTTEMKLQCPVRPLETPRFVTGIPAALLTHGELRKRRVRVFVSLKEVATLPLDVERSFLLLAASSTSPLAALDRPLFFQPSKPNAAMSSTSNVLYT